MMKSIITISTLILVAITSPVCAQQKTASERFSIHDFNQDGLIDRHEYSHMFLHWKQRHMHENKPEFSVIDKDSDGYITEGELVGFLNHQLRLRRRVRAREGRWWREGQ